MSLSRRNPKRDANEGAIIAALERCGVRCYRLSGKGCPDVLTLWQGRYLPLEIKNRAGRNRLTTAQQAIPWPIVRDVTEALVHVGVSADRPRAGRAPR